MSKYVNPFTDFGFKKIFGEEASKPILLDFLNSLLPEEINICDLQYKTIESTSVDRTLNSVIRVLCTNEKGEEIIIEFTKDSFNFFRERIVYNSTFPLISELDKGDNQLSGKSIYFVGLLEFTFRDFRDNKNVIIHEARPHDKLVSTIQNAVSYIYIAIPKFQKEESELGSRLEKWLYFIKNLSQFENTPAIFSDDSIFIETLRRAEVSSLTHGEYTNYFQSIKGYSDIKAVIETAVAEALKKENLRLEEEKKELMKQFRDKYQQELQQMNII